jgi:hypothetical protein
MLSGFDHAPLDAYIYSTSRLALLVAWLSLQCIFLLMCLVTSIPQEHFLDELHLLDTMASSCALEISSLNPIERHRANCLLETLCWQLVRPYIIHSLFGHEVHVPHVSKDFIWSCMALACF